MPILTQAVNQLTAEADLMTRFENDLEAITSQQGYRVDDVVDLVIDNDMTLEKQKVSSDWSFATIYARF
jgi:cupin superfamily acireductone dioxygenase involved in methionine salvage